MALDPRQAKQIYERFQSDPLGQFHTDQLSASALGGTAANLKDKLNQAALGQGASAAKSSAAAAAGGDHSDALTYHGQLLGISEPPYYTGAQVQLLIGTTFMLNAIDCTWNQNYDHLPYFGYRSEEYDYVFPGKTLVHGTLILNLLDNKLLELALDKDFKEAGAKSDAQNVAGGLAKGDESALDQLDQLLLDKAKTGSGGASFLSEVQRAASAAKSSASAANGASAQTQGQAIPPQRLAIRTLRWLQSQQRFGIDIRCNIGDPLELGAKWAERRASVYEVIKGVIFTGENRSLRVSAEVIAQAYTFFAKSVDRSPQ